MTQDSSQQDLCRRGMAVGERLDPCTRPGTCCEMLLQLQLPGYGYKPADHGSTHARPHVPLVCRLSASVWFDASVDKHVNLL